MAMNQTYNQNMNSTEADKQNKMVNENQSNAEAVYETPDVKTDQKESDHKNKMEVYEVFWTRFKQCREQALSKPY